MTSRLLRVVGPRWGIPVLLAAGTAHTAGYIGRWDQWAGVWSETGAALGNALILGSPCAVASGAWVGNQLSRSGLTELSKLAARQAWRVRSRLLIELTLWLGGGLLLATAPATVLTGRDATYGTFPWLTWLAILTTTVAGGCGGLVVGSRIRSYLVVPIAAVATYVVLGFLLFNGSGIVSSLTPADDQWMAFYRTPAWIPAAQIGVACLACLAWIAQESNPRWSVASAWLAGVLGTPLLWVGDADRVTDPQSFELSCDSRSGTSLCLPAVKAYLREDLSRTLAEFHEFTRGLTGEERVYIDDEFRGVSQRGDRHLREVAIVEIADGEAEEVRFLSSIFDLSAYTQVRRDELMLALIVDAFPRRSAAVPGAPAGTHAGPPPAEPHDVLVRWAVEQLDVPTDGSAGPGAPAVDDDSVDYSEAEDELRYVTSLSPDQRDRWFTDHRAQIAAGTLTWSDFE